MIVPPLMSDDIVPHMGCCITISPTPCADPTLNIKNLCQVMASVMEWYDLGRLIGGLDVPPAVCDAILANPAYKTVEEKREALLLYYLHTLPLASWQHVAGAMHYSGEATALQAAEVFLKYTPAGEWSIQDCTCTWRTGNFHVHVFQCLHILRIVWGEIRRGVVKIPVDPLY